MDRSDEEYTVADVKAFYTAVQKFGAYNYICEYYFLREFYGILLVNPLPLTNVFLYHL